MAEKVWHLACGHMRVATGPARESAICTYCHSREEITGYSDGYAVKCANCRYGRNCGLAQINASRMADQHSRKWPLHTVQVLLGKKVIDTVRPRSMFVELPFDSPPF